MLYGHVYIRNIIFAYNCSTMPGTGKSRFDTVPKIMEHKNYTEPSCVIFMCYVLIMIQDFIEFLKEELGERMRNNPSYSIRKFAKDLGDYPHSSLAAYMGRRRKLTMKTYERLAPYFGLPTRQDRLFRETIEGASQGKAALNEFNLESPLLLAVAYSLKIKDFRENITLLAKKFKMSQKNLVSLLDRLVKEGIVDIRDSEYHLVQSNVYNPRFSPEEVQEVFAFTATSITESAFEDRRNALGYIPLPKDRLPEFREKIIDLYKEFMHWSGEHNDDPTDLYQFTIGLNPRHLKD